MKMLNSATTPTHVTSASSEIFETVKDILINVLCTDPEKVTPEALLREDLGAESIDFLDLTFRIEQRFGLKIQVADLPRRKSQGKANGGYTVEDFVRFIEERLAANSHA